MAELRVLGTGPVEFTDSQGGQVSIPLSALRVNDQTGGIHLVDDGGNPWVATLGADNKAILDQLLLYFGGNQTLKAAPPTAPQPALFITAATPGPEGNDFTLEFKDFTLDDHGTPRAAQNVTFAVTVREEHTWENLTVQTIAARLGTDKSQPPEARLVHVKDGTVKNDLFPVPADKTYTAKPTADVLDPTNKAVFTVETRKPDDTTTITIKDIAPAAKSFTLEAVRVALEAKGITLDAVVAAMPTEIRIKPLATDPTPPILAEAKDDKRIRLAGGSPNTAAAAVATARE